MKYREFMAKYGDCTFTFLRYHKFEFIYKYEDVDVHVGTSSMGIYRAWLKPEMALRELLNEFDTEGAMAYIRGDSEVDGSSTTEVPLGRQLG